MKIIITEQQFRKLNKSSEYISNVIVKYMNKYISKGKRKITPKSRNYGNLREDWCINGKETIVAIYYFKDGEFDTSTLIVSKSIVDNLSETLSIRKTYILNVIAEWYEETMIPKFEEVVGETGLSIDDVGSPSSKDDDCIPEPEKPENITDDEMIDFIVNNTLHRREEVIDRINSRQDTLEDFYLQILDIVNSKKIRGL